MLLEILRLRIPNLKLVSTSGLDQENAGTITNVVVDVSQEHHVAAVCAVKSNKNCKNCVASGVCEAKNPI